MSNIISVTLRNNVVSKTVNTPSDTPLRSIFEDNGVDYASGVVSLDGAALPAGSMDKSLEELGVTGTRCYLMVTVKADNASEVTEVPAPEAISDPAPVAQIKIVGNTVHVISSQKLEDVKLLAKYRPNALKLFEGSGAEKREVFSIFTGGKDGGAVCPNGVIFSKATTADGKALITLTAPADCDDVKAWAQEEIGVAILLLKKTEAQFADAIDEVKAERDAVAASITVA